MKKRMFDADCWDDPWFYGLDPVRKCFWLYLITKVDNAGVWKVNLPKAAQEIGAPISDNIFSDGFSERIVRFDGGRKWWIPKFIDFQQPNGIDGQAPAHNQIRKLLERHGLADAWEVWADTRDINQTATAVKGPVAHGDPKPVPCASHTDGKGIQRPLDPSTSNSHSNSLSVEEGGAGGRSPEDPPSQAFSDDVEKVYDAWCDSMEARGFPVQAKPEKDKDILRLMFENDKARDPTVTPDNVLAVIRWLPTVADPRVRDGPFPGWGATCQSVRTLRAKWSARIRADKDGKTGIWDAFLQDQRSPVAGGPARSPAAPKPADDYGI